MIITNLFIGGVIIHTIYIMAIVIIRSSSNIGSIIINFSLIGSINSNITRRVRQTPRDTHTYTHKPRHGRVGQGKPRQEKGREGKGGALLPELLVVLTE